MARPRKPRALALIEGRDRIHPGRYRGRNDPGGAPLGDPPEWLSAQQVAAWCEIDREMPWLRGPHRALTAIASILVARLMSGQEVGVQAMNLLRVVMGKWAATPVAAKLIAWPVADDDDDDLFRRA